MNPWGDSWGNTWGDTWGSVDVAAPYTETHGGADDRTAFNEEDEMIQIAIALITSGVLECR